jgi:mannose-6-phosphate isomerase-like protein (cupin superfamily)
MNAVDITGARRDFKILQTTPRVQTAIMRLSAGEASGDKMESHENSDQVVLVLEGDLIAQLENEDDRRLPPGSSLIIPAGTPHRLVNHGITEVRVYTCYAPPAYGEDGAEEGKGDG